MSNRTTTTTEDTTTARAPVSQPTQTAPVPSPETDRTPATTAQSTQPTTERSTMPERTAQTARADVNDRDQLPNTAGFLPLLALIGIGSLVGSRMLRRSRRI